jgi:hypothetical protein
MQLTKWRLAKVRSVRGTGRGARAGDSIIERNFHDHVNPAAY